MSTIRPSATPAASPRTAIVLTASIDPRGMNQLIVSDVAARRGEYLAAFKFALARYRSVDTIVFVDNSGTALDEFSDVVRNSGMTARGVVVGFSLNDFPRHLGKGYGEFRAFDEAVRSVPALLSADRLIKLTGRLCVKNLDEILRCIPAGTTFAADVHARVVPGFVDTRLMVMSRTECIPQIAGLYKTMDDSQGYFAEHAFHDLIVRETSWSVMPRLPREPLWIGRSGTMGTRYDSIGQRLRYPPKAIRRFMQLHGGSALRALTDVRSRHSREGSADRHASNQRN